MNIAELKDQLFELIERETIDPDWVREILATLPDGRKYFEQMKAALALADQLPVEPPPAGLDEMILGLAAGRTTER